MFRKITALIMLTMFLFVMGCSAHMHTVGAGAGGSAKAQERQWYILFGLVPLNTVDSKAMASGAADYDIRTEQSFLDIVMNIFTGIITVNSRTVTVTK